MGEHGMICRNPCPRGDAPMSSAALISIHSEHTALLGRNDFGTLLYFLHQENNCSGRNGGTAFGLVKNV